MKDFLSRLAARTVGALPGVRPLIPPQFTPGFETPPAPAGPAAIGAASVHDARPERTPSRPVSVGRGEPAIVHRSSFIVPGLAPSHELVADKLAGVWSASQGRDGGSPLPNPIRPVRQQRQTADVPRAASVRRAGGRGQGLGTREQTPISDPQSPTSIYQVAGQRPAETTRSIPANLRSPLSGAGPQGLRPRVSEIVFRRDAERRVVNVTIGRIEVRAAPAPPPSQLRTAAEPPTKPSLTLEKYLEQRDKGER